MFKKSARFSLRHIGGIKYEASVLKLVTGKYGARYGEPKDFKPAKTIAWQKNPAAIPKNPATNAKIIYKNLYILKVNPIEKSGIAKEQIPVIATIIINIGLTKFALTAASPQY